MAKIKLQFWAIGMLVIFLAITGCAAKKTAVEPTCNDALNGGIYQMTDDQIDHLLDRAISDDRINECWAPLMKRCLDDERNVSGRHLAKAVHQFNSLGTEKYFHTSVFRYLSQIVHQDGGAYRDVDQRLLLAYSRYVIRQATTKTDPNLRSAEQLCQRLDPDLYQKLFF